MPRPSPEEANYARALAVECAKSAHSSCNTTPVTLTDDQIIYCIIKAYGEAIQENDDIGEFEVNIVQEIEELEYADNPGS